MHNTHCFESVRGICPIVAAFILSLVALSSSCAVHRNVQVETTTSPATTPWWMSAHYRYRELHLAGRDVAGDSDAVSELQLGRGFAEMSGISIGFEGGVTFPAGFDVQIDGQDRHETSTELNLGGRFALGHVMGPYLRCGLNYAIQDELGDGVGAYLASGWPIRITSGLYVAPEIRVGHVLSDPALTETSFGFSIGACSTTD